MSAPSRGRVLALSGGIGGAKLARGRSPLRAADDRIVGAQTRDQLEHLGRAISPDLDTLLYTLSGLSDEDRGWGRRAESWNFMTALAALGGESWFQLGDGDLATHVERTRRLKAGETLSAVTDDFCRCLGITARLLPMSDDPVRTHLRTDAGWLDFQDYFVRRRCEPVVREIAFAGAETARVQPEFLAALRDASLRAVIVCPSNPLISIAPILALPGVREALRDCPAPVVAVSPIVGGRAIKGPTAKMMRELERTPSAGEVARFYAEFLDGLVFDESDAPPPSAAARLRMIPAATVMKTLADRDALAQTVLDFADALRPVKADRR
jgi:LPPG:FO 2-phospho-L-lactate transferase